ncbi:MAG: hypothetical protein ACXVJY_18890, partial [Ilumatobacteraceae bacterium]
MGRNFDGQSLYPLRNMVDVNGGGGSDNYVVNTTGTSTDPPGADYIVNLHDTGAPTDVNTLTINGLPTTSNIFLLRQNFVAMMHCPTGHACGTLPDGSVGAFAPNYERINYDTTINTLHVVGGSAPDQFYVDDNSAITVLDGGAGADSFQFGQMFGTDRTAADNVAPGDEIATLKVQLNSPQEIAQFHEQPVYNWLSRGISYATTAYGGDGNDVFSVYSNKATLKLLGEANDDTFIVRAFLLATDPSKTATSQTLLNGGSGNDLIEYNVNAPVGIDGGTGFNSVVVIGTEANDNFVVTKDGVMGAGLFVTYVNVQKVEVDGLGGNDNFFVLSTAPGVVTVLDGGNGSDTFNVGGDVTGQVVALNPDGTAATINHSVSSNDPLFNNIYAAGVPLTVGSANVGQVVVGQPAGGLNLVSGTNPPPGASQATYTVSLGPNRSQVDPGTIWYMTVAAAPTSLSTGGTGLQVSTDGVNWFSALVLTFDSTAAPGSATDWARVQTIDVRAQPGSVLSDATVELMHSIFSTTGFSSAIAGFAAVPISAVDVHVIDGDVPGLIVTTPPSGLDVIEGAAGNANSTSLTQYQVTLTGDPGATVTVTPHSSDSRLSFSGALIFDSSNWFLSQTITISAADPAPVIEGNELATINETVTATGGAYAAGVPLTVGSANVGQVVV